jgi:hypothetical protein
MSTPLARLAFCLTLSAAAACSASAPYGFHRAIAAPLPSRELLGEVEIQNAHVSTAYEAITRLRPSFIRWQRITTGNERRLVYVDGTLMGGLDWLQAIPATDIHEVRLLTPLTGSGMYPLNNSGGAIMITTKYGLTR